jgi:HD-like signal output (HDOD) protein
VTMIAAATNKESLLQRLDGMRRIPTIPAILAPLLRYLEQPVEQVDVHKVAELIAQDKPLAAQCLQMANSPLFGPWQKVDSLRGAIIGLGIQRVSDIAMSCSVLNLLPAKNGGVDPVVFWEHSLGCALVCRRFARKISFADPSKAYLAGLLHDLGIIVNLWALPQEFRGAYEVAGEEGIPLHEAEQKVLGFTHCDSGGLLAEKWALPPDLVAVVAHHHAPQQSENHTALVTLVELSDLLCRMTGPTYGYVEKRQVNLLEEPGFAVLAEQCPSLKKFDWARLTFELDSYMDEVYTLVRSIYRS